MTRDMHIPALDGLRGFAALLVILSHLHAAHVPSPLQGHVGDYGVMLFFVLSGFLMGHLYLGREPDRYAIVSYGAARVARIVPLYGGVALTSFLIYSLIDPTFPYHVDGWQLARLLTLTSSEAVFWSIGPEFQFYFIFPFIWMASHLRGRARRTAIALILVTIILCFAISPWMPGFSVFSKLHVFVTGIALALLVRRTPDRVKSAIKAPAMLTGLLVAAMLIAPPAALRDWIFPSTSGDPKHLAYYGDLLKVLACATIIFSGTFSSALNDRIWGNALMRRLGAYSFSLYLLHMPAFHIANLVQDRVNAPVAVHGVVAIALSLLFAALSYHFYELPANVAVRRKLVDMFSGTRGAGRGLPSTGDAATPGAPS